jgi:hypothetical protein
MAMDTVSSAKVAKWADLPNEAQLAVFRNFSLDTYLLLRRVCAAWKTSLDSDEVYWNLVCNRRFGEARRIWGRAKVMDSFFPLFQEAPVSYFKIFKEMHRLSFSYKEFPPFIANTKYSGYVKFLTPLENSCNGAKDLCFIDEFARVRRIAQKDCLSSVMIKDPEVVAQLPANVQPHCMASSDRGLFIGTNEGMVYFVDMTAHPASLHEIFDKKLPGEILTLKVSQVKENKFLLFVIIPGAPGTPKSLRIYQWDLGTPGEKGVLVPTNPMDLYAEPTIIHGSWLLCPLREGGIAIYDTFSQSVQRIVLMDETSNGEEPALTSLCVLADRIVFADSSGRVGWFGRVSMKDTETKVTWCKAIGKSIEVSDIIPIGSLGFCVSEDKSQYWLLPSWKGEYKLGWSGKSGMENPIWLENGRVVYSNEAKTNGGIFYMDYGTCFFEWVTSKVQATFASLKDKKD